MVLMLLSRDGTASAVRVPDAVLYSRATPGGGLHCAAVPVAVPGAGDLPSCVGHSLTYMPAAGLLVASLRRVAGEGPGWLVAGRPVPDGRLVADVTLASQPTDEVRHTTHMVDDVSAQASSPVEASRRDPVTT